MENFTYLESIQSNVGDIEKDVKSRTRKTCSVCRRLQTVWGSKVIILTVKFQLYNSIVILTALYAYEICKVTPKIRGLLDVFHLTCLRKILKISWRDKIRNDEVLSHAKSSNLSDMVVKRCIQWTGHIIRLPEIRPAKIALSWIPQGGRDTEGDQKRLGEQRKTVKENLQSARTN